MWSYPICCVSAWHRAVPEPGTCGGGGGLSTLNGLPMGTFFVWSWGVPADMEHNWMAWYGMTACLEEISTIYSTPLSCLKPVVSMSVCFWSVWSAGIFWSVVCHSKLAIVHCACLQYWRVRCAHPACVLAGGRPSVAVGAPAPAPVRVAPAVDFWILRSESLSVQRNWEDFVEPCVLVAIWVIALVWCKRKPNQDL